MLTVTPRTRSTRSLTSRASFGEPPPRRLGHPCDQDLARHDGCVPAFDTNFKKGFGVATFGRKSLRKIGQFYRDNTALIDAHREMTLDFDTGAPTERRYTWAKVIDMVFFIEGMP